MGLAILAGAIGIAFANIDRIRRFKGAGFEAETWERIQAVVDKETELETVGNSPLINTPVGEKRRAVIFALGDPKYTWRYLGGLARDAKLEMKVAEQELSVLVNLDVAKSIQGRRGPLWTLTESGRVVLAKLQINQNVNK